jgi:hypothetical protein
MARQERLDYHARRARQELEWGRNAVGDAAAHAHFALSELHLACYREVRDEPRPALRLVVGRPLERDSGPDRPARREARR